MVASVSINWERMTRKAKQRSHRFTAVFESDCEDCGNLILDGDVAGYIEDVVYCEECCDKNDEDDD